MAALFMMAAALSAICTDCSLAMRVAGERTPPLQARLDWMRPLGVGALRLTAWLVWILVTTAALVPRHLTISFPRVPLLSSLFRTHQAATSSRRMSRLAILLM